MSDERDLSGIWYGDYGSSDPNVAPNGFIAQLNESVGWIGGSITERDLWRGGGIVRAMVKGSRVGSQLSFTKTYDGSGGLTHTVDYRGRINADATEIRGMWTLPGHSGNFVMSREKFVGLDAEIEEAAAALV